MDKFGIFKLLNSFYDYYKQNNENVKKDMADTPLNFKQEPDDFSSSQDVPHTKSTRPLQSSMLNTISSHDELVNRVKNKK